MKNYGIMMVDEKFKLISEKRDGSIKDIRDALKHCLGNYYERVHDEKLEEYNEFHSIVPMIEEGNISGYLIISKDTNLKYTCFINVEEAPESVELQLSEKYLNLILKTDSFVYDKVEYKLLNSRIDFDLSEIDLECEIIK